MSLNNINFSLTRLIIVIVLLVTTIFLVFDKKSTVLRVIMKVTEKLVIVR